MFKNSGSIVFISRDSLIHAFQTQIKFLEFVFFEKLAKQQNKSIKSTILQMEK